MADASIVGKEDRVSQCGARATDRARHLGRVGALRRLSPRHRCQRRGNPVEPVVRGVARRPKRDGEGRGRIGGEEMEGGSAQLNAASHLIDNVLQRAHRGLPAHTYKQS